MKKKFLSSLLLVIAAAIFIVSFESCRKDNKICDDKCIYGDCIEGDCVCDDGYEGVWCSDEINYGGSSSGGSSSGGSSSGGSSSGGSSSGGSSSGGSSSGGGTYELTFWSNFNGNPIDVYVGGSYAGTITNYYSSSPGCGASGCVTLTYSSTGTVYYSAEDGDYTWNGSASVTGSCNTMLLHL